MATGSWGLGTQPRRPQIPGREGHSAAVGRFVPERPMGFWPSRAWDSRGHPHRDRALRNKKARSLASNTGATGPPCPEPWTGPSTCGSERKV